MEDFVWGTSWHHVHRSWFLLWLAETADGSRLPRVDGYRTALEPLTIPGNDLTSIAAFLEERGLVRIHRSMGGILASSADLTPAGNEVARQLLEIQDDNARQRIIGRNALLSWLYDQQENKGVDHPVVEAFLQDPSAYVARKQLTVKNVDGASLYLREQGLIDGVGGWGGGVLRARVLSAGIDCIENFGGSVRAYLDRHSSAATTINVQGDNNAIAAGSPHAQQTIVSVSQHLDLGALTKLWMS